MRTLLLLGWLLVPLAGAAYHYGPGQERLRLDEAATDLAGADRRAEADDPLGASARYDAALAALPADRVGDLRAARIERDKANLAGGKLAEAYGDLDALVDELQGDAKADPTQLAEARGAQANARYYLTWLMKLEGLAREEWEPVIEASRQAYRLLAEQAEARGDGESARRAREDVEAAIRLARMEPGELQGLPLPKQCQGTKSGNCKGKKPGKKPGNNGNKPPQDSRSAGSGPPPDGSGS